MSNSEDRLYDLVVFGASGSVGRFIVEEVALVVDKYYKNKKQDEKPGRSSPQTLSSPAEQSRRQSVPSHVDNGIKWAIAGRSAMRLNETLCRAELSTGVKELSSHIPIILADLNHQKSLNDLCSKTRLIINCTGPYTLYSEVLIKICIDSGTNYIDLSNETDFNDEMRLRYSAKAREASVYIISGCGFLSMSAEMGLNFVRQVVDGQIEEVKIILNLSDTSAHIKTGDKTSQSGIISSGMWSSFLANKSRPKSSTKDRQLTIESSNTDQGKKQQLLRKDTQSLVKDVVEIRNRKSLEWFQLFRGVIRNYCLPIDNFTNDRGQLVRGEMTNYEIRKPDLLESSDGNWRPIRCSSFICLKSFVKTIIFLVWMLIFEVLIKFSVFRKLMKTFPSISTCNCVYNQKISDSMDRDSISHIKFSQTFIVHGIPGLNSEESFDSNDQNEDKKVQAQLLVARIVGPEPNHVATATYAVQASLALILERDHLPTGGGVLTPGVAFSETNIIYQLRRRNIKFEVLKQP